MPQNFITVPRSEYQALLREARRGVEVCVEVSALRLQLLALERRVPEAEKDLIADLQRAIEACDDVSRLRVELSAFERRLREFDQDFTPLRPPSRTDIKAAFDNSVEFARGQKKPPGSPPEK